MNKKLGILLLVVLLSFAACGDSGKETGGNTPEPTKEVTATAEPELTEAPEVTEAPAEPDYAKLAVQAEDMIVAYVEALKAGDVDTILSMTKPDSDLYEDVSKIKDVEGAKEFLQAMFAGTCCYTEGTLQDTERNIKYAIEDGKYDIPLTGVKMAMPDKMHFSDFVPNAMYEDGEVIPKDYTPASAEEAIQVVKNVAKELPVTTVLVKITAPDESGKMYVKSGTDYFDFLFDTLSERQLTEEFVIHYVTEECKYLGGKIVNSPDGVYKEDDEVWKQILPMLEQKDMAGLFDYYITLTGKDLRDTAENSFVYGDVKNLTPEQQAYVDSFVDRIVFQHCDLTRESTMERDSDLMYIVPVLDYDEKLQAWLLDNNVTEISYVFNFKPDKCIETMTHPYLMAALYAKDDQVPALIPAWTGKAEESTEVPEISLETLYTVTLTELGPEKIKAIKLYRDFTGAGLAEAKNAVESTPCLLIETTDKAEAELVKAEFEAIGSTVTVNFDVVESTEVSEDAEAYVVSLIDAGAEMVKVIKAYRETTGCGLKEAKDAVESTPCTVIEVADKVEAERIAATFTEVGATVEISVIGENSSETPGVPQTPEATPTPVPARVKSAEELAFEARFATYTSDKQMTEEDGKILADVLLTCWKELDLETLKLYDADATNHRYIEQAASVVAKDPEIAEIWKKIMGTLIYDEETGLVLYKNVEYMAYRYYTDCYLLGTDCPYNSVNEISKPVAKNMLEQYFDDAPYSYLNYGLNITYKTVDGKLKVDLDKFLAKTFYVNLKYLCRENVAEGAEEIYWGRLVFGLNVDYAEDFSRMENGYPGLKTLLSGSMKEKVDVFEANVNTGSAEYRIYEKVAPYYTDAALCEQIGAYFDENCAFLLAGKTMRLYTPNYDFEKYRYAGEGGTEIKIRDCHSIGSFGAVRTVFDVVYDMKDYGLLK